MLVGVCEENQSDKGVAVDVDDDQKHRFEQFVVVVGEGFENVEQVFASLDEVDSE